jgi:hypothetical protein
MRIYLFALSLFSVLFSGCAFHSGHVTTAPYGANFTYLEQAFGQAKTLKVLGIGSINRNALINEARQAMMANRPIATNEGYANVSVDIKNGYYLLFSKTTVTVSADIIAYSANPPARMAQTYGLPMSLAPYKEILYPIGHQVFDSKGKPSFIKGHADDGLFCIAKANPNQINSVPYSDCYVEIKSIYPQLTKGWSTNILSVEDTSGLFRAGDTVRTEEMAQYILVNISGSEALLLEIYNPKSALHKGYITPQFLSIEEIFVSKKELAGSKLWSSNNF